jgi:hypothetical protein
MCGVIQSVLANEKNLVSVRKWGKGKEEQGTRVMAIYVPHICSI